MHAHDRFCHTTAGLVPFEIIAATAFSFTRAAQRRTNLSFFQSYTPPGVVTTLHRKITRCQVWAWIGRSEQNEHHRGIIRTDFRSIALGTANQHLSEIDRDREGSPDSAAVRLRRDRIVGSRAIGFLSTDLHTRTRDVH